MIGKYTVIVSNARVQYKFTIERSVTILRGDLQDYEKSAISSLLPQFG